MQLTGNTYTDSRYAGTAGPPVRPQQRSNYRVFGPQNIGQFKTRWNMMRLEAMSKWYARWRDISRYINPKRGFFEGFVPNYNAQIDYKLAIDPAPARAARILAAGMTSGLSSPSRPWFRLGLEDRDLEKFDPVKEWLEAVHERMMRVFEKSNIYGAFHQTYEELGMFGTGAFGLFEDHKTVIRARTYTIGEYYLACDAAGRPNAFARQFWMTVDQLVEEYGWKNCSKRVQNIYESGQRDTWILVYYLCEANSTISALQKDFRRMEWRSVTWEAASEEERVLRLGGFEEFPVMAPRWDLTTTADVYGVGCGAYALGDVKQLYRMVKDDLLGLNKMMDPPVMLDSSVEGIASMLPGGVTRSSAQTPNAGVKAAYQINPDFGTIGERIQQKKQDVYSGFYADLFLMMIQSERRDVTAREVAEKHDEKLIMLGPVINRVTGEMHSPTIDRTFGIMSRAGMLPPPPEEIQGMDITVEFISLLAQAQKMVGTAGIESLSGFAGHLGGAIPEALDVFDADEAIREYADMLGTPARIIRAPEKVAEIRKNRAAAQKAAADAQNLAAQVQGAKVLSETQVNGGNMLGKIMGDNSVPAQ